MNSRFLLIVFVIASCGSHSQADHPDSGNSGGGSNLGGATSVSDCDPGCVEICQADTGCECVCDNTGGSG